jgi:hypothetical protein
MREIKINVTFWWETHLECGQMENIACGGKVALW